jgi:hypothetical protein
MCRPHEEDEQPEDARAGDGEGNVVEKADGKNAKYQRPSLTPEPDVLVKDVEHSYSGDSQPRSHSLRSVRIYYAL